MSAFRRTTAGRKWLATCVEAFLDFEDRSFKDGRTPLRTEERDAGRGVALLIAFVRRPHAVRPTIGGGK